MGRPKNSSPYSAEIKTLEEILKDGEDIEKSPIVTETSGVIAHETDEFTDFVQLKELVKKEANNILDSLVDYYLSDGYDTPYVDYKKKLDVIIISNLLNQLKCSEIAIQKLLQQIDMGNVNARMFEVLANMQGKNVELSKAIIEYHRVLEDNYKKMKYELDDKKSSSVEVQVIENKRRSKGSNIIKELKNNENVDE